MNVSGGTRHGGLMDRGGNTRRLGRREDDRLHYAGWLGRCVATSGFMGRAEVIMMASWRRCRDVMLPCRRLPRRMSGSIRRHEVLKAYN
jgi:hypothetical protein